MEPHCLGKATDPGRSGGDARLFIEAVPWIARTGSPWRDRPAHFGNWSTAFRRFNESRLAGVSREACSKVLNAIKRSRAAPSKNETSN